MAVESKTATKSRASKIIGRLKRKYPDARCSLDFKSVHQLMVATILSAQCTDDRVNKITKELFKKYRSVKTFAAAEIEELGRDIYSAGFYQSKAKSIISSAQQLVNNHAGRVPDRLDELVKLRGVGRKTASVILGVGYGLAEGIVVDTHVGRITRLLDLTKQKTPEKVEEDLMDILPDKDWILFSHLMIYHGRAVCIARRPECNSCCLKKLCPYGMKVVSG